MPRAEWRGTVKKKKKVKSGISQHSGANYEDSKYLQAEFVQ